MSHQPFKFHVATWTWVRPPPNWLLALYSPRSTETLDHSLLLPSILSTNLILYFFLTLKHFYWSIADLQYYVSFRCTGKWISHTYTYPLFSFCFLFYFQLDCIYLFIFKWRIIALVSTKHQHESATGTSLILRELLTRRLSLHPYCPKVGLGFYHLWLGCPMVSWLQWPPVFWPLSLKYHEHQIKPKFLISWTLSQGPLLPDPASIWSPSSVTPPTTPTRASPSAECLFSFINFHRIPNNP